VETKKNKLFGRIDDLSPERRSLLAIKIAKSNSLTFKKGSIPRLPRDKELKSFPLSFAQQQLWLVNQLESSNPIYNICKAFRIVGKLNVDSFEQSLNEVIRRHETLRTVFKVIDGQPMQVVAPALDFPLPVVDIRNMSEAEQDLKIQTRFTEVAKHIFNLSKGPLLRAALLRLGYEKHIFLVTMHHIISDGWSAAVFFRELTIFYEVFSRNKIPVLPGLGVQYVDFSVWQRQWLKGKVLECQLNYWKKQLGGQIPVLELPTDKARPPFQTYRGARQSSELSAALTEKISALSKREKVTVFMTLIAAFKIMLHRITGQDDIVVGSPVANRNHSEIEGLIGFIVNTLVLRTDVSGNPTFRQLLKRVREVVSGAYAQRDLPFEILVKELQPERDMTRSPIFQVFFNMLSFERVQLGLYGLKVENLSFPELYSKFDLTVQVSEQEKQIQFELIYNTDLFEDSTIAFMLDHFRSLLENIAANPGQQISKMHLLNGDKRLQLSTRKNLVRPTNRFVEFDKRDIEQSIPERFEQLVEKYPKNIAIKTENDKWTYEELNKTANKATKRILAVCRSKEDKVGLLFEHGAQMIAGIFGILKAGKVYVPLDPSLPIKRIAYMIEDSQIKTILTNNMNLALAKSLSKHKIQIINMSDFDEGIFVDNINLTISPDAVAYILYTSGSTGSPKGVMQTHCNVLHHIRNYINGLHICNCDKLTLFSSYCFDAAMMDIMGALLNGATLCPIDIKEKSPAFLSEWLIMEEITIYHSTPTVYRYLISSLAEDYTFPKIRLVVLGGEEVYKKDVDTYKKHFSPDCIFINTYGPTESTIALQYFINNQSKNTRKTVPIGYPVEDTDILLLDNTGEVTEVYGEIAIASNHVATGYWQRPEMTRKVFLSDPVCGIRQFYRTGDMGHLLPDGSIEFKGRKDHQVKIRGFRVEPGEIESQLSSHEAIKECAVATSVNGQGDKELVAYIVSDESVSPLFLRRYLRAFLPDYMIPSRFIQIDAIPIIHNGKTDYASLSLLMDNQAMKKPDYVPPVNSVEKKIAEIWQNVLDINRISLHENFFDLGGHSLMVVKVISLIEKELGIHVPFREFFNQTLGQFSASCEEKLLSSRQDYAKRQC